MSKTWAIIGGGNGGQTIAGHLLILGERVRLYDVVQETVDALNNTGCITLHHALEGTGQLEFATTDMEKAVDGADIIMITLPAIYHENIARKIIPFLRDGMVVFLHPEASCGAIAFRKYMKDMGCTADVVVGASCTLLYSTRAQAPGDVFVFSIKNRLDMAALPASDNAKLEAAIRPVLPWFEIADNVLLTSLNNLNAMMHPAPMLLSASRIEADPFVPYQYYLDGITPSVGAFVEAMDKERVAVAAALGVTVPTICEDYIEMYACGTPGTPLYKLCQNNKGYEGIMAASTLRTRYVLEDVPYSLEAIRALAKVAGIATPCMDAVITIGHAIMGDGMDEGRTGEALGIAGMDKESLLQMING